MINPGITATHARTISTDVQEMRRETDDFPVGTAEKMRVAAYCRVSTDSEQQAGSLETQMHSFNDMIASHAGWELAGVYADADMPYGQNPKSP